MSHNTTSTTTRRANLKKPTQREASPAIDPHPELMILEYQSSLAFIPRSIHYPTIPEAMRFYLPDLPAHFNNDYEVAFETKDLAVSRGEWVKITRETWSKVAPTINRIRIVTRRKAGEGAPGEQTSLRWSNQFHSTPGLLLDDDNSTAKKRKLS
ncbi:hypothetical protein FA15DRAFT_693418 [Coprinopsis marcescibilis]|nr:hypothetical protein FA15DRAFT_693418 [Coprinopsis marcescibilis]